nr:hypothetical protein Iba_chr08cCG9610 [Ipomoea batatas]GMD52651.1 hypothetical protein Iba_scaffold1382052CG0010 [Ipomoea batatas]GME01156.1 hypothetical protein Iba_contig1063CG0010 [Ipomoea batatas]
MIPTSTGMWFFRQKWRSSFRRIGFSPKMNGEL